MVCFSMIHWPGGLIGSSFSKYLATMMQRAVLCSTLRCQHMYLLQSQNIAWEKWSKNRRGSFRFWGIVILVNKRYFQRRTGKKADIEITNLRGWFGKTTGSE